MTGNETGKAETIVNEAWAWHVAASRDDMDWDGFMAWLDADPRHQLAYDQIALADSLVDDHRDDLVDDDADQPVQAPRRWAGRVKWGAGLAIAASLAAVFAVPHLSSPATATYQTSGASRAVALEDGSKVLLAPRSRLVVTGGDGQRIELSGGAWFDIRHDPARTLAIKAGPVEITDIGTRFDVQATDRQARVAVAEGEVQVASSAMEGPVRLQEGRELLLAGDGGKAVVHALPVEEVGEWRQGRITYTEAPLPLVVADLARYSGVQIEIGQALHGRLFSGTLVVGDGEAALRDLSQLMGLELHHSRSGYRIDGCER